MDNNDPGYNPGGDWFSDAPGGNQSFDQLFPDPNGDGQQPAPNIQQPPQDQFFLKTSTGTVYKTADDAVTGITHKDNLIEQLRQDSITRTGYDPITKKQVRQVQAPPPPPTRDPSQPVQYTASPQQYWDDLVNAANRGDKDAYFKVQAQLVQERVNEQLAPFAPLIATVAKQSAVDQTASQFPEFRKFYGSEIYNKTLESVPSLAQAIQIAETNPQAASQLGDLYKLAYLSAQGLRLSEAPQGQPPVVSQPQAQPPRPTLTSGYIPPPNNEPRQVYDSSTREGRQQQRADVIKDQIAKGVLDLKF